MSMTKQECYDDLKQAWDNAAVNTRCCQFLISADFNAMPGRPDVHLAKKLAVGDFESLPADMRERMVTEYFNANQ
jgi:hypothetical protein